MSLPAMKYMLAAQEKRNGEIYNETWSLINEHVRRTIK